MGEEDIHISAWDLKKQYRVCNFGLKAEIRWSLKRRGRSAGLSSEGRDPLVTQADRSAPPCVFSGRRNTSQKESLPQKKDMWELSLWLYFYYTLLLSSKNKNISYIFKYLRVLRCLSSGAIYYIWSINRTLTVIISEYQSGQWNNGNLWELHSPHISSIGASPQDSILVILTTPFLVRGVVKPVRMGFSLRILSHADITRCLWKCLLFIIDNNYHTWPQLLICFVVQPQTYTNICGNIVNNNDDFNERTNTLLYKNIISHTLFSKGWWLLCVRNELETGTDRYIDPKFFFEHSSTSSWSWLGLLNRVSLRAQSPLSAAGSHFGILTPTDSNRPGHLFIILSYVHLLSLFFRLFTKVDWRLGRGSIYNSFHFASIQLMTRYESILSTFGLPVQRWQVPLSCPLVHMLDLSNLTYIFSEIF